MAALTREQMLEIGMSEDQIRSVLDHMAPQQVSEEKEVEVAQFLKLVPQTAVPEGIGAVVPINCTEPMKVTSINDLQSYAQGTLVRFPDFAEGQPFVARVRRPSMLVLAKEGRIPNTLLVSANELFSKGGGGLDADNENMLADIYSITEIICEAALKEPTYQQIKDAGLELSDDQLMAVFNYTQTGVKALESFR